MERRVRGSLIKAGVSGLIALAFMVCSNPIDIVGNVTTEVKAANNKFLIIKGVGPALNTTNVNPGLPLTIAFDRDISLADIEKNVFIAFDKPPTTPYTLSFSYNQTTKTLTVDPDPFLGDDTTYTVTITPGVKGADGSDLQNEYSWSFKTGVYPAGNVKISDVSGNELTWTNDDTTPSLHIRTNNLAADRFRLGRTEIECLAAGWQGLGSTDYVVANSSTLTPGFTLGSADGVQAVYIQFARSSDSTVSLVEADTVIMDKTLPTVDAGQQRWVNSVNTTTPYLAAASDLNGIKSYAWSAGAPVVISPTNVLSPTLSAPGGLDGNYPVTLTVVDNAGNPASSTMTLTRDTVAPTVAPTITTPTTPTASAFPLWTWTKGVGSTGGESTAIYRVLMDGVMVKDKSITANYVPPIKPPIATGLADGAHTLTVYETDNAGNLSPVSLTSTVMVTVFPTNGQVLVNNWTPLFQWHTMWDRNGYPAEFYYLHIGVGFVKGEMKQLALIQVKPLIKIKGEIQSYQLTVTDTILNNYKGPYFWYVDMPKQGVRSPADPNTAWSFNVTKM